MKPHRLSPSKLDLAAKCAWWARPDVEYVEPAPGRAARIGTLVHSFVEAMVNGASASSVGEDGDVTEIAEAFAIAQGPIQGWIEQWKREPAISRWSEIVILLDTETGVTRLAKGRKHPDYAPPVGMQMIGELDLTRVTDDEVIVEDIKTGKPEYFHDEQIRAYCALAASHFGKRKARGRFVRTLKTKVVETDWITLDGDDLDAENGRLRRSLRLLPDAQPQTGDWCWRCPGRFVCPERSAQRDAYVEPDAPALLEDVSLF